MQNIHGLAQKMIIDILKHNYNWGISSNVFYLSNRKGKGHRVFIITPLKGYTNHIVYLFRLGKKIFTCASSKSVVSKADTLSTSNYLNKHIIKKGISA